MCVALSLMLNYCIMFQQIIFYFFYYYWFCLCNNYFGFQQMKVVMLEDLAARFKLRTQVSRIESI